MGLLPENANGGDGGTETTVVFNSLNWWLQKDELRPLLATHSKGWEVTATGCSKVKSTFHKSVSEVREFLFLEMLKTQQIKSLETKSASGGPFEIIL